MAAGAMTEFVHLAEVYRAHHGDPDLLALSMRLSTTPCSRCTNATAALTANSPPSSAPSDSHPGQPHPTSETRTEHVQPSTFRAYPAQLRRMTRNPQLNRANRPTRLPANRPYRAAFPSDRVGPIRATERPIPSAL